MAPRLLVLDDYEGRIAGAPAMARLRELAEVTVLDRALGDGDQDALARAQVLLAVRERTRIDSALLERLPDFRRAYEPDGMSVDEFEAYGATVRTLRAFISSYWDLVRTIDDLLLPSPDVRRG